MTSIEDRFLTIKEVAGRLKLSPRTSQRFIDNGGLEAVRVGRPYRITQRALDKYLERNRFYRKRN